MEKGTVLIIEDNGDIREGIRILLQNEGYQVKEAADGITGWKMLNEEISLVILDIMMPGISGIDTCKLIREKSTVPVLFLTAKSSEMDKLQGFGAGGDDYLVKPFSYIELKARVGALIRRNQLYDSRFPKGETTITIKNLQISMQDRIVVKNGEIIELTEKEHLILNLLLQYRGKVFSVENIYTSIWQEPFLYTSANTVMVHIRNIRAKIEDNPQQPEIIKTVWGRGYKID